MGAKFSKYIQANITRGGPRAVTFSFWLVVKLVHITGYCIGAMKQCWLIISRRSRVTSSMSPGFWRDSKVVCGSEMAPIGPNTG